MPADVMKLAKTDAGLASALRISVMRLSRRLRNERDASDDLTANQLAVLGTLFREGSLTVGDLAAAEKVQPPSMTRVLAGLEERKLILRTPHASDGRQHLVSLTADARTLLKEDRRKREAWLAQRLAELTQEERDALRAAAPVIERLTRQ